MAPVTNKLVQLSTVAANSCKCHAASHLLARDFKIYWKTWYCELNIRMHAPLFVILFFINFHILNCH